MQLHINYTHPKQNNLIAHTDKIMLMGSCFAENIGEKLLSSKFNCLINPNGILFNPLSIANAITTYIGNSVVKKEDLVETEGMHKSLNHHGSFAFSNKTELIDAINDTNKNAHKFLKVADFLIITLGSSLVYRVKSTGKIAANCHKLPQNYFVKEQLQPQEIIEHYDKLLNSLKQFSPSLKIIFTVSPVKYLRDGLVENNLSKSVLIYSIHQLVKLHDNCSYFPAYELVNDDLRDYRFYKEDMAHPNEQAINYVWEKFSISFFAENTNKLLARIDEINRAQKHRPINDSNELHMSFKNNYLIKCKELEKDYPYINFNNEISYFSEK